MHKNSRLTPKGREVLIQRLCNGQRPAEVAQAMGISETTLRKWWRWHRGIGREYVHVAIDDHSRTTLASVAEDDRQEGVVAFLHRVVEHYRQRGIQTALREWAYAATYRASQQRRNALGAWLHHHNWHRPTAL